MALIGRATKNIGCCKHINWTCNTINGVHTTTVRLLDQDWRRKNRLTQNPNKFGPLTNLPDYSFADGRPTPFGIRQLGRINEQREILQKVKQLAGEIDYAVERHARLEEEKDENRRRILEGKLKPKGEKLIIESIRECSKIPAN